MLGTSLATGGGLSSSPSRPSYDIPSQPFHFQMRALHHCRYRRLPQSSPPSRLPPGHAPRAPASGKNGAEMEDGLPLGPGTSRYATPSSSAYMTESAAPM